MALISKVGRTHPKVLLGIAVIYLLLSAGAITMIYPFMITLTSAVTNDLDYERFSPYPKYLFDSEERYLKYLSEKYADQARLDYFKAAYQTPSQWGTFRDVALTPDVVAKHFPVFGVEERPEAMEKLKRIAEDYFEFLDTAFSTRRATENVMPLFLRYNLPEYQRFLQDHYETLDATAHPTDEHLSSREREQGALALMAQVRGDVYDRFISVDFWSVKNYAYALPKWQAPPSARHLDYLDWIRQLPARKKMPVTRHFLWTKFLFEKNWDIETYNKATGTDLTTLLAAPYPNDASPAELQELRQEFERDRWPARLVRLQGNHRQAFMDLLRERYPTIESLNKVTGSAYASWREVPFSPTLPYPHEQTPAHEVSPGPIEALSAVWRDYAAEAPLDQREMLAPETAYQAFLLNRYGSLDGIREAYGWETASLQKIGLPIPEADYYAYVTNQNHFMWQFLTFNYTRVIAYMATKGRALWNTLILVLLTIFATLTVNPLAAYALSRFQMRSSTKILVFLLATMAFPPEVAMIPSFLLLRDLGLLNTFGALVLPSLANGFSIFLLKGFFDSLPRELYEAASIDGASELRMFTTITLPLCKPILAVIALHAFIAAYGGFMWAFLVCQDPDMWTLMVWLYQFQQANAGEPYMTMAALVLASIPTLIVFLTCQRIILRGIIIPTMK